MHRQMLALQVERLRLLDEQIAKLNSSDCTGHEAEVGVTASTFSSAAEFTSWVGTCPGKVERAEENSSSRSAKGNKYMRRVLNQAAHAAARSKGTHFQAVFRSAAASGLSVRCLGHRSSPMPLGLEDSS
jgi:transposase